ncbi:MAG TPA: hypothetical protein ACFCUY_15865 [Xenococcaceae cyanobacterium]
MFHNLKSTTERLVTVLMLLVALIACEQAPESTSESNYHHQVQIESQPIVFPLSPKTTKLN